MFFWNSLSLTGMVLNKSSSVTVVPTGLASGEVVSIVPLWS